MGEANLVGTDWSKFTTGQRIKHLEIEGYVLVPDLLTSEQVVVSKANWKGCPPLQPITVKTSAGTRTFSGLTHRIRSISLLYPR